MDSSRPPRSSPSRTRGAPRRALLLLFFLSGAAALIYEVLWLKELGLLFGVTAHAAATTLAVFFLGLAAGSLVWGRRVATDPNPLRTYASLELGIALTAALYFGLVSFYRGLYPHLFAWFGDAPALFLFVKLLLAAGVLFLPAFLMGGTLPVMGQYLVRRSSELGRTASALYALNTFGAAVGALAAGFVLPAYLGFRWSYLLAMGINVVVAATAGWWSSGESGVATQLPAADPTREAARGVERDARAEGRADNDVPPTLIVLLALASGFLTLGLEVLWTRMFAQVLQNSVYTFSLILAVFLGSLALGSLLAHALCRKATPPRATLQAILLAAGILVGLSPVVFVRLTEGLSYFGSGLGWNAYLVAVFGVTTLVLLPPVVAAGSVFPYLMKLSEGRMTSAGKTIGRLASLNTFAAILGSLAAGFVLLDWIGLWRSLVVGAMGYFLLALLAGGRPRSRSGAWRAGVAVAGILGAVLVPVVVSLPTVSLEEGEEIVDLREGAAGTVAVVSRGGDLRLKVNNTYSLGTSGAAINERVQAWLPLSLHPEPRSAFFLGLGTGITAGAALDFPLERLLAAELDGGVVRASRVHFAPWTNGLFTDPRARVVTEDGRNVLLGTGETWDVVIADIFLTYRAGVGALYTREHFAAVYSALEPDGIFAQWLPMFDLSEEEFGIVARTMLDVFPQVTLWRRSVSPEFPVYALVAQKRPAPLQPDVLASHLDLLKRSDRLPGNVWLQNIPLAAYAGNVSVSRELFDHYPLSTDDRRPLEYSAPRTERDSKGTGTTPVLAWDALARFSARLLEQTPPEADPYLRGVDPVVRRQVRAGLAYYQYTTLRRMGRAAEAQEALLEYRSLLAPP